jgi:MYXO-CTERM domain-containing protein
MLGNVPMSSTLAMTPDQILDAVWPTYRIRVFYDTGRKFTDGSSTSSVLAPMVPFGYRLHHDGAFYGFTDSLESADPGVELVKLNDNWYRVHFKNEETPIHIRTKITAEEKPRAAEPKPCPDCKCPTCPPPVDHKCTCNCRLENSGSGPRNGSLLLGAGFALALLMRRRSRNARELERRARCGGDV